MVKSFDICGIPTVLYGEPSERCYLFLHGKEGCKEEGAAFYELVAHEGWQVLAIDLPEHGERKGQEVKMKPWSVVPELVIVMNDMKKHWSQLGLRANSIGAWFAMEAFHGDEFVKSLFVSPILDMNKLIANMMIWANVTKEQLKEQGEISTDFGETLSWRYYEYAKRFPIRNWDCDTFLLYGSGDNLTSREIVDHFVARFGFHLTVMDGGEHWFHTPEQVSVLNQWTRQSV